MNPSKSSMYSWYRQGETFPNIAEKYIDIGNYHDETPSGIIFCSTVDQNKGYIHTQKKVKLNPKVV